MKLNGVWKDIKGYEGLYQISNFGKVKSLARYVLHTRCGEIFIRERLKKFTKFKNGTLQVSLSCDGVNRSKLVHRLVAYAFLKNPYNLPCINHIDKNNSNNTVKNLEWVTIRDVAIIRSAKYNKTSNFLGVWYEKQKNRWRAAISIKSKIKTLGTFKTEIEAKEAYGKAYLLSDCNDRKFRLKD